MPKITLQQIQDNAPAGLDPWLTQKALAELTGMSEKWFAAAREGRKGASAGPRYIKLNDSRTSPVRYPLSEVIKWMQSFQLRDSSVMYRESGPWPISLVEAIHHAVAEQPGAFPGEGPSPHAATFHDWLHGADDSDIWPVIATDSGFMDVFLAMGIPSLEIDSVVWLPRSQWRSAP